MYTAMHLAEYLGSGRAYFSSLQCLCNRWIQDIVGRVWASHRREKEVPTVAECQPSHNSYRIFCGSRFSESAPSSWSCLLLFAFVVCTLFWYFQSCSHLHIPPPSKCSFPSTSEKCFLHYIACTRYMASVCQCAVFHIVIACTGFTGVGLQICTIWLQLMWGLLMHAQYQLLYQLYVHDK